MTSVVVGGGSTVVVVKGGSAPKRVTSRPTNVAVAGGGSTIVPVVTPRPIIAVHRDTIVKAGSAQGQQGPRGAPGGSVPTIYFTYGDAAGAIWVPPSPGLLSEVRVVLTEVFNGTAPTLQLGTLADPDAALPAENSDLTQFFEYEFTPDIRLASAQAVIITIDPDGSTQGAGFILLTFIPD